jgi:hypothetical protein
VRVSRAVTRLSLGTACVCALAVVACGGDPTDTECNRDRYPDNVLLSDVDHGSNQTLAIEVETLRGYPEIAGAVTIEGDVDLRPLHCLRAIGGGLSVLNRDLLLDGLEQLETLGTSLQLDSNRALPHLRSLARLASIGELFVNGNPALTSLDGLTGLRQVVADVQIGGNASLVSLDGLRDLDVGGGVTVFSNPLLRDVSGLSALQSLGTLRRASPAHWGNLNFEHNPQLGGCAVEAAIEELGTRGVTATGANCGNRADGCGEAKCPTDPEPMPGG